MSLENLVVIVEETVEVDDLMTLDQIKLAKKAIKIASPLIGGLSAIFSPIKVA